MPKRTSVLVLLSLYLGGLLAAGNPLVDRSDTPLYGFMQQLVEIGKTLYKTKRNMEAYTIKFFSSFGRPSSSFDEYQEDLDEEDDDTAALMDSLDEEEKSLYLLMVKQKTKVWAGELDRGIRSLQENGQDQIEGDDESDTVSEEQEIMEKIKQKSDTVNEVLMKAGTRCQNGGEKLKLRVKAYICASELVLKAQYDALTDKSKCYITETDIEGCYCSYDFYGRYCENFAGFQCTGISSTPYDSQCLQEYNKAYKNRLGYPPCRPFDKSSLQYEFEARLNCSLFDLNEEFKSSLLKAEGIKLEDLMTNKTKLEFTQPTANLPLFNYSFVGADYKVLNDTRLRMGVTYIDWERLFEPVHDVEERNLTSYVTGADGKTGRQGSSRLARWFGG